MPKPNLQTDKNKTVIKAGNQSLLPSQTDKNKIVIIAGNQSLLQKHVKPAQKMISTAILEGATTV